jgi:hypothetical protein
MTAAIDKAADANNGGLRAIQRSGSVSELQLRPRGKLKQRDRLKN